jgi:hypothetical protein
MVKNTYVNQRQRVFQSLRDQLVGLTGLCHPGWMWMRQQYGRGVLRQRQLHYLARMNAGPLRLAFFECL